MRNAVSDGDESGQIWAAYIAKEHLRALLTLARRRPTRDMNRTGLVGDSGYWISTSVWLVRFGA